MIYFKEMIAKEKIIQEAGNHLVSKGYKLLRAVDENGFPAGEMLFPIGKTMVYAQGFNKAHFVLKNKDGVEYLLKVNGKMTRQSKEAKLIEHNKAMGENLFKE